MGSYVSIMYQNAKHCKKKSVVLYLNTKIRNMRSYEHVSIIPKYEISQNEIGSYVSIIHQNTNHRKKEIGSNVSIMYQNMKHRKKK